MFLPQGRPAALPPRRAPSLALSALGWPGRPPPQLMVSRPSHARLSDPLSRSHADAAYCSSCGSPVCSCAPPENRVAPMTFHCDNMFARVSLCCRISQGFQRNRTDCVCVSVYRFILRDGSCDCGDTIPKSLGLSLQTQQELMLWS